MCSPRKKRVEALTDAVDIVEVQLPREHDEAAERESEDDRSGQVTVSGHRRVSVHHRVQNHQRLLQDVVRVDAQLLQ